MNPERWVQVKQIVYDCLELEAADREAHLQAACAGDPSLLDEVKSLLDSDRDSAGFMETPAMGRDHALSLSGKELGHYRLGEVLAEGGMGTVYRAARISDFEKQVAVKLVKRGMDTDFILRRFERERQILSALDHTNIARLIDGGAAPDGRPYLVMEYIEGIPITDYANQHKLGLPERVKLFRTVCAAVQYAHQNLIVHRDLKPSNILVTSDGEPKLLDFGIAKLLEPDAGSTMTSQRLMTPEFASPEQARGLPVTTATDIYSLGVLLYVLVTGQHPYEVATRSPEEIARVVCEAEPRRPSTVRPLSRDLENIVLKSIHKEPSRRYASVDQLSEDLRRYLAGMPVSARKDTFGYRASKFFGRHKAASIASGLVIVSVIAGLAATLWEARQSRKQGQLAAQRLKDVRALASSNLFELYDAISPLPGSAAARHLMIQRSLAYLDKMQAQDSGDPDLMREVAAGYERIAALQGKFTGAGIGDSEAAVTNYAKAYAIRSLLLQRFPKSAPDLRAISETSQGYVATLMLTSRTQPAHEIAAATLSLMRDFRAGFPDDALGVGAEALSHLVMGQVEGGSGTSASLRLLKDAIADDQAGVNLLAQFDRPGAPPAVRGFLLNGRFMLGFHMAKDQQFQSAVAVFNGLIASKPPPTILVYAHNWRGNSLDHIGEYRRALVDYRVCLEITRAAFEADPSSLTARINYDIFRGLSAHEEARLGDPQKASAELSAAIGDVEQMLAANPTELFYQNLLLVAHTFQGESLSAAGDHGAARAKYSQALQAAEEVARKDSADLESRLYMAKIHAAMGVLWARSGQYSQARIEFATAEQLTGELLKIRPEDTDGLDLAKSLMRYHSGIESCTDGKSCAPVQRLQLPTLIS